jgi:hypothetical protein
MNIVLLAIGKRGYHMAAYNLAVSIKHYTPSAKILLLTDEGVKYLHDCKPFDIIETVDTFTPFNPALAKLHVYGHAVKHFNEYLFLDVDTIALKDIEPFYSALVADGRDFITEVAGVGQVGDEAIEYCVWATPTQIWEKYKVERYTATNSSWHFARKSKTARDIYKAALKFYPLIPMHELAIKWGKCIPDELPLGAAIGDNDVSFPVKPMLFGDNKSGPAKALSEVRKGWYFLSIYANGRGRTVTKRHYFEMYDAICRSIIRPHNYKFHFIMQDKWINK